MVLLVTAAPCPLRHPSSRTGSYCVRGFHHAHRYATLTATPIGRNCLLEVHGILVFTGILEGATTGTTRALVFAPCSDVLANPPGTFRDIFRFTSDPAFPFTDSVNGLPTTATITY